jgi:hypothetical protein
MFEFTDPNKDDASRQPKAGPLEKAVTRTALQLEAAKKMLGDNGYAPDAALVVALAHTLAVNQAAIETMPR